jgi:hypothetical protein
MVCGVGVSCLFGLAEALGDLELQVREGDNGDARSCLLGRVPNEDVRHFVIRDTRVSFDPGDGYPPASSSEGRDHAVDGESVDLSRHGSGVPCAGECCVVRCVVKLKKNT